MKVKTIKMTTRPLLTISPEEGTIGEVVEVSAAVTKTTGEEVNAEVVAIEVVVPELPPTRTMKDSSPKLATRSRNTEVTAVAATVAIVVATGKAAVAAIAVIAEAEARDVALTVVVRARQSKTRLSQLSLRRPSQKSASSEVEARFV